MHSGHLEIIIFARRIIVSENVTAMLYCHNSKYLHTYDTENRNGVLHLLVKFCPGLSYTITALSVWFVSWYIGITLRVSLRILLFCRSGTILILFKDKHDKLKLNLYSGFLQLVSYLSYLGIILTTLVKITSLNDHAWFRHTRFPAPLSL